ncbi:hypothetical protein MPTK1_1g10560 [Marchantia polymorpha subsp. ruderalis]|uniref:Peptidase A1 domain-containing protein n=2 Tax=Marchantia polymorpha TaxID=3197 RepID=A0AAF6ANP6_MARPO|nr:hypothetical protein MARPO_0014s0171 [Marchantia polymorpha]BBM98066.1 hypothetical protein Mp_1g10560 [Marchantia polymorpha subsp. ruderalis]|eukprot:PTQ45660.1 hypothetical protein MARPO_0014s0171 [Marchantia polymorpha]
MATQLENSASRNRSLQMDTMVFTRALVLCLCVTPYLFLLSAATPIRNFTSAPHSLGLVDLHTEKGFATVLSLKRNGNTSRSLMERRMLVGDAHMPLHDDLLTKGYYTSSLFIGTPAHEFALIVDTGSTVTYVPCSTCTHCGSHQDPSFKPDASSTYEIIKCTSPSCQTGLCDKDKQCKYERQYAESSTSAGVLGKDIIGFGDASNLGKPKLMFGCENDETGDLYYQKADGIMGLGRGPLSIVDQLVQEKDMADVFSLCYGGMDDVGGAMIMGDFPRPKSMIFTASSPYRSPYYNIVLKQIKVAGTPLPVAESVFDARFGTVLDSGTTYAYLPETAFVEFKKAVFQQLGKLQPVAGPDPMYEDFCFAGAGSKPAELTKFFPTVDLVFGEGNILSLAPENYLFRHTTVPGAYCLGVFKNENDHTTLLGGIFVRNMLVTYDRESKKIGFWRTKCTDLWTHLTAAMNGEEDSAPPPPKAEPPPPPVEQAPSNGDENQDSSSATQDSPSTDDLPITDPHIGGVELNMSVNSNYTTFAALSGAFLTDMARDLELDPKQVKLLAYEEQGEDVAVTCSVRPPSGSPLPGSIVQRIIVRLKDHQVRLHDLGSYNLVNWRLIQEDERSSWWDSHRVESAVLISAFVVVLASGSLVYWYFSRFRHSRTGQVKYVTVDALGDDGPNQL